MSHSTLRAMLWLFYYCCSFQSRKPGLRMILPFNQSRDHSWDAWDPVLEPSLPGPVQLHKRAMCRPVCVQDERPPQREWGLPLSVLREKAMPVGGSEKPLFPPQTSRLSVLLKRLKEMCSLREISAQSCASKWRNQCSNWVRQARREKWLTQALFMYSFMPLFIMHV